ncbi:MAG: QueT transporter family protein [Armatimonadetes bacterium]|nr:QueT transporter family protein [Armatimonadota bacterium]
MAPRRVGLTAFAEICVVAALYAALTIALSPISYGPIQFRVPEVLKSLVIWRPHLVAAFVVGNFLSNLTSPQVGAWELGFMPLANLVGASLCVMVGRRAALAGAAIYALVIAAAVALMLSVLLRVPFAALFPPLLLSEALLIIGGVPIMARVHRAVQDRQRGPGP